MCGLAGLLSLDPAAAPPDPVDVARMCARLAHRGPDGAGAYADGPVALGFRRLAIVDVAGGRQPIANEDGSIHAVCNGELYDHAALRAGVEQRGHRLRSGSDAEILVHLYEERGPRFVEGLRGMFAIALWDGRRRRLVLVRDPFGIKPLYHARLDGRLAFASELGALTALPGLPRDLDPHALETYLAVNAVMGARTMLRAVRRLEPGHLLVAEGGSPQVVRYARPAPVSAADERTEPEPVLARETRERLSDSVRAHLQGDVPVGVLLSGGVDSGLIAALAAGASREPLRTFTVGFTEPAFNELAQARLVARRYGTEHHELRLGPEAADELAAVAMAFDEPRGDATALPYWLAARHASRHVKVVLSGEGGDELFGGYQTYQADRYGGWVSRPAAALEPLLERWPSSSGRLGLDYKLRRLARGAGLGPLERHHAWKEIFATGERREFLVPGQGSAGDPLDQHRARYAETVGADPLARLQDLDVGTFLADDLLVQTDQAGMAHGLEIRVPFLDPVVAELALALPARAKVSPRCTKRLLRAAAEPLLPASVVRGAKRGFCAPAAAWLRGPLHGLARDVLCTETLRRQGIFRPEAVQATLERHVARRADESRRLWALMAFTLWYDTHVVTPAALAASVPAPLPPLASLSSAAA